MKVKYLLVLMVLVALGLTACGETAPTANQKEEKLGKNALKYEQRVANASVARITKREPVPVLYDSSDAHNQRLFLTQTSDPNKIQYLTLISLSGTPYAHFTIKGQVSSMATSQTNFTQLVCKGSDTEYGCGTIGQPEANGIYQGPDAGHFAFTTNGALIEWEGNFITSDQPFNIKTPVTLSLNENVAPTKPDLKNVENGELPTRK